MLPDGSQETQLTLAPPVLLEHEIGIQSRNSRLAAGALMSAIQDRNRKVALITDGSYLAEFLLGMGYAVHGIVRRSSSFNRSRIEHLCRGPSGEPTLILHYGDLTDTGSLVSIISQVQPSEIYNLASQSDVRLSFDMAVYTAEVNALGPVRLLDAIRSCGLTDHVRFFHASTSELYGKVLETPQNERTPFCPRSPYAVAKSQAYGIHACTGILFNHESPRRGEIFVTKKITRGVAEIILGKLECVYLGNIDAKRDWAHARDFAEGFWRILQHDEPQDFVLATGELHSVREFIEKAFFVAGKEIKWEGKGVDEVGIDISTGNIVVRIDPKYLRPLEVDLLLGDPTKANKVLGWTHKVDFDSLIREMVLADIEAVKAGSLI